MEETQLSTGKQLDLRVYLAIGLIAMGGVYFLASYVVPRALVTLTKAAPATIVSLEDSRLLGEKILAKADGKDQASINVFVMDKSGKGVANKSVTLTGLDSIEPPMAVTNSDGKANFKAVSSKEGQFVLEASVEGALLSRTVTVTFRN